MIKAVQKQLDILKKADKKSEGRPYANGSRLYDLASCQVLTDSPKYWDILVCTFDEEDEAEETDAEVRINFNENEVFPSLKSKKTEWNPIAVAALKEMEFILSNEAPASKSAGKVYTREGMIKRVMEERREKAA